LKRKSGATGPKVSSIATFMSLVTPVRIVGSKKRPPSGVALAAEGDLGALGDGVGDVLLDLGHRVVVDERPETTRRLGALAHLERAHLLGELRGEGVVHRVLT
jgi:hypothetical protein